MAPTDFSDLFEFNIKLGQQQSQQITEWKTATVS